MVAVAVAGMRLDVGDAYGPVLPLLDRLEERLRDVATDANVIRTTGELTQACSLLVGQVRVRTLRHLGSGELREAIRSPSTRDVGDAWAWSRKTSEGDITALIGHGCTVGVSAMPPELGDDPMIY
jgi:hypothetical protein